MHARHREPVTPVPARGRLLDYAGPARQHAEKINVARRPVRHAAPMPRQNRRARRRDENNDPRAVADIVSRATDFALRAGANPAPRYVTGGPRRPGHPTIPVNPKTLSNPHAGPPLVQRGVSGKRRKRNPVTPKRRFERREGQRAE